MLVFVIRRVLVSIPVLIASTLLTFLLVKVSGDPLEYLRTRNPRPSNQVINLAADRLYLNHSWPAQYWHWITNLILHGQWGPAARDVTVGNIGTELMPALLVTARLVAASVIIALILAVVTGVLSAVRQYSVLDFTTTTLGFLFLSMPVFWFGILLKQAGIWYNTKTGTQTFFTIGDRSDVITDHSVWGNLQGHRRPLDPAGDRARPGRLRLVEQVHPRLDARGAGSDYVRLARAKGLSRARCAGQARAAHRADPVGHGDVAGHRGPARRGGHHRDGVPMARHGLRVPDRDPRIPTST